MPKIIQDLKYMFTYPFCVKDDYFYNDYVDEMFYGVISIYTVDLKI